MEKIVRYEENGWVGTRQKYPDGKVVEEAGRNGTGRERTWSPDGNLMAVKETYPREPGANLQPRVKEWSYRPDGTLAQTCTILQSGFREVIGYAPDGQTTESFKRFDDTGKEITPKPVGGQQVKREQASLSPR